VIVVYERDAHRYIATGVALQFLQHIDVTSNELPLGDDRDRVRIVCTNFEASASELVVRFDRLVTIRVSRKRDELSPPRPLLKGLPQALDDVDLHDDLPLEVRTRAKAEIRMRRARIAIRAPMKAPPIRIHTPPKTDVRTLVLRESALGLLFMHAEIRRRGCAFPLDMSGFEAVWRVAAISGH
jgi:hypothetical protein